MASYWDPAAGRLSDLDKCNCKYGQKCSFTRPHQPIARPLSRQPFVEGKKEKSAVGTHVHRSRSLDFTCLKMGAITPAKQKIYQQQELSFGDFRPEMLENGLSHTLVNLVASKVRLSGAQTPGLYLK